MKKYLSYRIYIYDNFPENNKIVLGGEIVHYITSVLRLKAGDKLRVFNEKIGEYLARITGSNKKEIILELEDKLRETRADPRLTIAPCLIKNDRIASLIDMSVQLGATHIIPIISARTVHRNYKTERLQKIIIEATEQSERMTPAILQDSAILTSLNYKDFDAIIFANEKEADKSLVETAIAKKENILLITGPEGGFTYEELVFLTGLPNVYSVSLGQNILRAETAMVKLISYVQFLRMTG